MVIKRDFVDNEGFTFLMKITKECLSGEDQKDPQRGLKHKTLAKILALLDDLLKFEKFFNKSIDQI